MASHLAMLIVARYLELGSEANAYSLIKRKEKEKRNEPNGFWVGSIEKLLLGLMLGQ